MVDVKSTIQWIIGIFFCILALGMLVSGEGILGFLRGFIAAVIFAGAALLAIPTTRRRISRESGIAFSTWMVVGLVFVGMTAGMIIAPDTGTDETDNITDETASDIDDVANGENGTEADDNEDDTEAETDEDEGEDGSDSPSSQDDSSDVLEVGEESDDSEVEDDDAYEPEVDDTTGDAIEDSEADDEETADDSSDTSEAIEEGTADEDSTVAEDTEDESTTDDVGTEEEAKETPISSAADAQGNIEVTGMNVQGSDPENEWIELTNVGDTTVDMSGWIVRDRYDHGVVDGRNFRPVTFPSGFTLEPDESVKIVTAPGENTDDTIHWGYNQQNWNQDGDVIIVLDANGNTVLEHTYGNPSD